MRTVDLVFGILIEIAMGVIRLIAVVAGVFVPVLGLINAIYLQESGPLLQVSPPLRIHYITWSSIFSIVAFVGALRWGEQANHDVRREKRTFALGLILLLTALVITVAYPVLLGAYDNFLTSTSLQGWAWSLRNLLWSLALVLTYSLTFSLISLGMTLITVTAYQHARERIESAI